jgi:hypothetical protein
MYPGHSIQQSQEFIEEMSKFLNANAVKRDAPPSFDNKIDIGEILDMPIPEMYPEEMEYPIPFYNNQFHETSTSGFDMA